MNKQKKCLVIGGGSDIGEAIVIALHRDKNFEVTWSYCHTDRQNLPGQKVWCDMTSEVSIRQLFDQYGDIDLLVTAAFPFLECDNFDYEGYLKAEAFLRGHILAMTLAVKKVKNGRIINILGQCVERGLPGAAFYSGAFAFLSNYGNSINGKEGKSGGTSVCSILLGPTETREWDGISSEVVDRYKTKVRDFISCTQVADTVKFLAEQTIMPSTFKLDAYYGY